MTLIERGCTVTQSHWPDLQLAFDWIHRAAHIMTNHDNLPADAVRRQLSGLLGAMKRWQSKLDSLAPFVDHFLKITRSYWPGLFHCYDLADLPRTNNDLEQLFGHYRQLERRITGRKSNSGTILVNGSVRLVSAVVTAHQPIPVDVLSQVDTQQWADTRAAVAKQRLQRVRQRHFRQSPESFLSNLEERIDQLILPP